LAVPVAAAAVGTAAAAAVDQVFHHMTEKILLRLLSLLLAPSGALQLPSSAPLFPFGRACQLLKLYGVQNSTLEVEILVVVVAAHFGLCLKDPTVRFPYPVQRVLGDWSCHHAFLLCLLFGVLLGLPVAIWLMVLLALPMVALMVIVIAVLADLSPIVALLVIVIVTTMLAPMRSRRMRKPLEVQHVVGFGFQLI